MIKLPSFIRNKVKSNYISDNEVAPTPYSPRESDIRKEASLTFKIFPANGGYIVEFYKYDRNTDRSHNSLYVIHSADDMTAEIASICQREFLQL